MAAPMRLSVLLEAVDRLSAPLARVQARIDGLAAPIARIGAATAALGRASGLDRLASRVGAVGASASAAAGRVAMIGGGAGLAGLGGIAAFNSSFIRPAADAENLMAILETVEGSAQRARHAFAWVDRFAEETPYELRQVSDAFVMMRTAGVDPMAGALRAAGDAAAVFARGDLGRAVDAFRAALRGEFDPLESFGIQARTVGEQVVLTWEAHGRRFRATVDKNNRALMGARITRAWNDVAGGGMARLARSWDGMMSNLRDSWSRFTLAVMQGGVFDFLKQRLERLLGAANQMRADGSMQSWAEATSAALIRAFEATERFLFGWNGLTDAGDTVSQPGAIKRIGDAFDEVSRVFRRVQDALRPMLGDLSALEMAAAALAAVTFAPLIGALAALGVALLTTPAGLAIAAIGAIALAGLAIRQNWGGVADWLGEQWEAIKRFGESSLRSLVDGPLNTLRNFATELRGAWEGIQGFFSGVFEGIERRAQALADAVRSLLNMLPRLGGESPTGPTNDRAAQQQRLNNWGQRGLLGAPLGAERMNFLGPPVGGLSAIPVSRPAPAAGSLNVGGEVRVMVDDRRVEVSARADGDDVRWNLIRRGWAMGDT